MSEKGSPEHFARYLQLTGIVYDKKRLIRELPAGSKMAKDASVALAETEALLAKEYPEMLSSANKGEA